MAKQSQKCKDKNTEILHIFAGDFLDKHLIELGVPQGTILGHLLFII